MKVIPKFSSQELANQIQQQADREVQALLHGLTEIGERCVTAQRQVVTAQGYAGELQSSSTPYTVQTGNLASSTGYIITYQGKELHTGGFEATPQGTKGGAEGIKTGKDFAKEVAKKYNGKGIQLVVVAGMHYARYVQNLGYDVLDTAELVAEKLMKDLANEYNR